MKQYISKNKTSIIIFFILSLITIITLIISIISHTNKNIFLCLITIISMLISIIIELKTKYKKPQTLKILIYIFIFSSNILGEIYNLYLKIPSFDNILHILSGIISSAVGFSIIKLSIKNPYNTRRHFFLIFTICFTITLGTIWEFCEFTNDYLTKSDCQKDELVQNISSIYLNGNKENTPLVLKNIQKTIIVTPTNTYTIKNGYLDIGLIDTIEDLFFVLFGGIIFLIPLQIKKEIPQKYIENFLIYK